MRPVFFYLVFSAIAWCAWVTDATAQNTLKIGVLGAMSGPAKYWGLTNKYCALVTAKTYNDKGGIKIGNQRYQIDIVSFDTELNPERAIAGAKSLINQQHINYLIGPNIDDTSLAILPVLEAAGAINVSYGFSEKLFQPPRENTYLGMIHPSQSAPTIYRYLQENHGIKSIAFLSGRDKNALNQRNMGFIAAQQLGLKIKEVNAWDIYDITYSDSLTGAERLAGEYVKLEPDYIVLSGITPEHSGTMIALLRQKGYQGLVGTETAQDPTALITTMPGLDGFVSLGSALPEALYSDYMKAFVTDYLAIAGEWHEEAGVKAYALEAILRILQHAGPEAINNTEVFKQAAENFEIQDPFSAQPRPLKLIGTKFLGAKRQLNVPFTIHLVKKGKIHREIHPLDSP